MERPCSADEGGNNANSFHVKYYWICYLSSSSSSQSELYRFYQFSIVITYNETIF